MPRRPPRPAVSPVGFAVFASGVASMGLEIVAGRLLAPAYGSSIYVWGSIIGVFLAALSLGYWVGGRRAGTATRSAIAAVLAGSTLFVAALVLGGEWVVEASAGLPLPQRYAPLVPVTVLFGPPTVLLGFVSPYAAELVEAESTGGASGHVYALGTVGSIVGAFATTFLLVPSVGVVGIELVFGVVLLLAGAVVVDRTDTVGRGALGLAGVVLLVTFSVTALGVPAGEETVYRTQTAYQELRVADSGDVRTLYLDGVRHSAMYLDRPNRYVFEYTRYFHLPLLFRDDPDVDRVLFVGGGGFSGPKRFVHEYDATVDVVEIDPAVVDTAERYFRVNESDDLDVHTMDGRVFLQETNRTYDVVVLDAYRADRVPHHLATVEFMRTVDARLADDGVVVANVISARRGTGSEFYRAEYRTMARVFPQVYSFPTSETTALQNIELVATKSDERVTETRLHERNGRRDIGIDLTGEIGHYRTDVPVGDVPVLRDDYAPVDRLLQSQAGKRYVVERTGNGTATASP